MLAGDSVVTKSFEGHGMGFWLYRCVAGGSTQGAHRTLHRTILKNQETVGSFLEHECTDSSADSRQTLLCSRLQLF